MRTYLQIVVLTAALLLMGGSAAQGQSGSGLRGPSLGLMSDPASASIRPILGIPGAATLGTTLNPGFASAQNVVAPGGDFALAVEKHGFGLSIVRASGTVVRNLTPNMGAAPDLIALSPLGGSAVAYYRTSERLFVLTGLRSDTPRVVQANASSLPAVPSRLAVSEDATALLAAAPEGSATSLYFLPNSPAVARSAAKSAAAETGTASARRIGSYQSVSALSFAGAGSDALVADSVANMVYALQDVSGTAQSSLLGSAQDGLSQPVAVAAMDARRVLVANAGADKLTLLYRDGTAAESIACGCSPSILQLMPGNFVYRLTEPSKQPVWILDAGRSEPRVLVIPPESSGSAVASIAKGVQR